MSDIFDHELDAYESMYSSGYTNRRSTRRTNYNDEDTKYCKVFNYNPLYYHVQVYFVEITRETQKAYCFKFDDCSQWIPKSTCRNLELDDSGEGSVYIHKSFLN